MAAHKIGFIVWLSAVTGVWTLFPLLFAQSRGVIVLALSTGVLALLGWGSSLQILVFWSGVIGLLNITIALVLTNHEANLWIGLSAGLTLLALLDASQRWSYIKSCQVEAGVLGMMLETFVRVSGLSLALGLLIGAFITLLGPTVSGQSFMGYLTLVGASLFAGFFAVFLLYASRTARH
jgi:hypothetical protein